MAFSNRKDEAGVWRLRQRSGPTFQFLNKSWEPTLEIRFTTQANAKGCADELNEQAWASYDASRPERKRNKQARPYSAMISIIRRHGGLPDWDRFFTWPIEWSEAE